MEIKGNTVTVNKSDEALFSFFTQVGNFEQLMPESTQKFEVDGDSFLFALKGMPEIRLVLKDKTEFSDVTLGAASGKLPFTLSSKIDKIDDNQSNVQLIFKGEFNAMMAMMVKKPLTSFIDTLTENIAKL
ncbi:SRPBCC family protein [Flavobacteriaceae bacterium S356]|uniref:SRPBCC family protein n=1 Tax=Asprobacillus argus TaxID=3076534 RepID=A0ABU3LGI6_9FLAO|nr:SRPBCC family protein [Flavobacteriaceae bacterium S356]